MNDTAQARGRDYAAAIDGCKLLSEVVEFYADALRTYGPSLVDLDWRQVNGAILRRWSRSSLENVKRAAWKRVEWSHENRAVLASLPKEK